MSVSPKSFFLESSMQTKIAIVVVVITLFSLVLTNAAEMVLTYSVLRQKSFNTLTTISDMQAKNLEAFAPFSDRAAINERLSALASDRNILLTCIFDAEGGFFYSYVGQNISGKTLETCPPHMKFLVPENSFGNLRSLSPVKVEGEAKGYVYLSYDFTDSQIQFLKQEAVSLLIILFAIALSYIFANAMLRSLLVPLIRLKETVLKVGTIQDYSIRVKKNHE